MMRVVGIKGGNQPGGNIFWIIYSPLDDGGVIVVDPGNSRPILDYLKKNALRVDSILITHHHGDHTAGIQDITDEFHCPVLGPENEQIENITQAFTEGDVFERAGIKFEVLSLPGHTLDHIGFIADGTHFFCGDVIFGCGCGRVFEGSMGQMLETLQKCAALAPEMLLYWGHELTSVNLTFATQVEPGNEKLMKRLEKTVEMIQHNNGITAPVTLEEELMTNPFLRTGEKAIQEAASELCGRTLSKPEDVFTALREKRNNFS